jgi:hypothetical protein
MDCWPHEYKWRSLAAVTEIIRLGNVNYKRRAYALLFYVGCCLCNRLLCFFIAGLPLVKVRDQMFMYFWGEKRGGMERDWEYRFSLFLVW